MWRLLRKSDKAREMALKFWNIVSLTFPEWIPEPDYFDIIDYWRN